MIPATNRRAAKGVAAILPAALLAPSLLVPAAARADCLLEYANCVDAASELDSFGKRSFAGLRCYFDLISCLQRRLA